MTASRYRGSLAVWLLLLAYASLYPFYPLRLPQPEAAIELFLKPRYIVRSDIAFNIVAYVPLGMLACLYFRQAGERTRAILKATALGAALSFLMEAIQLFIPNRVSSIYDVIANSFGALLGALAFADPLYSMVTRPLGELRDRLLIPGPWGDASLVLLMLWLLSQLNPALPFFGAGDIGGGETELALLQWSAVAMSVCGFGLFISVLLRGEQGALRVTLVLLSVALWLKFAMATVMLQPHVTQEWMQPGRIAGLVAGVLALVPARHLGRAGRIYLAFVLILAGALFAKIFGAYSPLEELLRLFRWPHGQLASFATLTRFIHEIWPFAAVTFLVTLFLHERRHPAALE
jgi:VanZ family protein